MGLPTILTVKPKFLSIVYKSLRDILSMQNTGWFFFLLVNWITPPKKSMTFNGSFYQNNSFTIQSPNSSPLIHSLDTELSIHLLMPHTWTWIDKLRINRHFRKAFNMKEKIPTGKQEQTNLSFISSVIKNIEDFASSKQGEYAMKKKE